jgi:hypothetical protein
VAEPRHQFETRRRRLLVAALSAAGHLGLLLVLLSAPSYAPPIAVEPAPIPVQLVTPPRPPDAAPPAPEPEPTPAPPNPTPVKPPPPRRIARPTPAPPPDVEPIAAGEGPTDQGDANAEVSDAELAGAATAGSGSGSGGRGCDMTRWLPNALRKDRLVQAAVAEAHRGKALRVWDGDWVRHAGQEGNGLAAVREAIMWEVAFAPVACRNEPVHGLVLISLNDGPGSARLVMGSGRWRWSDLLLSRSGSR